MVVALVNTDPQPLRFELPEEPAQLVRPPLQTRDLNLEVPVLSRSRTELSLVRFADMYEDRAQAGRLAWKVTLPARADGIAATLAPESKQSARHIATVTQSAELVEVFHTRYGADGQPAPFQSARVPKATLVSQSDPAIYVDEGGTAHVSFLALVDPERRTEPPSRVFAVVQVRFGANGRPTGEPQIERLGLLRGELRAGTVVYVGKRNRVVRREAFLLTTGDETYHWHGRGTPEQVHLSGRPVLPLQLAPGREITYVLLNDPVTGPYFDHMEEH